MAVKGTGTIRTETQANIQDNITKDIGGDTVQGSVVDSLDSLSQDLYDDTIPYEAGESIIFTDNANYLCLAGTTPAESPSTTPAKWEKINSVVKGDTFDFNNIGYYDTNEKGLGWAGNFLNNSGGPIAYYYEGTYRRVYFTYFEGRKDSAGNVRGGRESRNWINYFDIDKNIFSEEVTLPESYPDTNDLHNLVSIIVTNTGYIIIVKEELNGPSGTHNSPVEVWKSDSPEDISAFTKVTTLNYEFSYLHLFKITDGTLFLYCRERIGGNEYWNSIFKSEDEGDNWTSLEDVADTKTQVCSYVDSGFFLYPRHLIASRAQGINMILNPDLGTSGNYESVLFMHSDDGITWKNARQFVEGSGGFSHNIISSGTMTKTILDTNFLVDGPIADPVTYGLISRHGCIDPDGIPYIIAEYYVDTRAPLTSKTNRTINLYIYYYDIVTHAWIKKDVMPDLIRSNTEFGYVNTNLTGPKIITYGNGRYDIITGCTKNIGNLITSDVIISSATLTAGIHYRIITTNGSFGNGRVIDDVFKSDGTEVADGSNTVIVMRTSYFVFRTEDYGESWSYIDLDSNYTGVGGHGAMFINYNCLEKKQLFFGGQTGETANLSIATPLVEYANITLYKGWID